MRIKDEEQRERFISPSPMRGMRAYLFQIETHDDSFSNSSRPKCGIFITPIIVRHSMACRAHFLGTGDMTHVQADYLRRHRCRWKGERGQGGRGASSKCMCEASSGILLLAHLEPKLRSTLSISMVFAGETCAGVLLAASKWRAGS